MVEKPGILGKMADFFGSNKFGLMGAIGGALLAAFTGGMGNPLLLLLGVAGGGLLGGFLLDKKNGALNNLLGRSETSQGRSRGGQGGPAHSVAYGPTMSVREYNTGDFDINMHGIHEKGGPGDKTQITDIHINTDTNARVRVTLNKPVMLNVDKDGMLVRDGAYNGFMQQINDMKADVNRMTASHRKGGSGHQAHGLEITPLEVNEFNDKNKHFGTISRSDEGIVGYHRYLADKKDKGQLTEYGLDKYEAPNEMAGMSSSRSQLGSVTPSHTPVSRQGTGEPTLTDNNTSPSGGRGNSGGKFASARK